MMEKCKHDYNVLDKITKSWKSGSDGRNGSYSEVVDKAILKCSKCGHIKEVTF